MMSLRRPGRVVAAGLLAAVLVAGCAAAPQAGAVDPADSSVLAPNPTRARLQDLSGSILLFHGAYGRLPRSLSELRLSTGLRAEQITDPVSHRPFIYRPAGLASSSDGGAVVLLAAPAPADDRCFAVAISRPGRGLLANVVTFPAGAYPAMRASANEPSGAGANGGGG